MAYGLDKLVQQKTDAYRGNPQALMQRYQQNQELLDLLALQKIKSEKDAAMREMQMQMQQQPQTVKQQLEQQLQQQTKQELVQQTKGIMDQRQQQAQKRLNTIAGIGAQPGTVRMAQGGIVGYQEGGPIDEEDRERIEELKQRIKLGDLTSSFMERAKGPPRPETPEAERLRGIRAPESRAVEIPEIQTQAPETQAPETQIQTPERQIQAPERQPYAIPTRDDGIRKLLADMAKKSLQGEGSSRMEQLMQDRIKLLESRSEPGLNKVLANIDPYAPNLGAGLRRGLQARDAIRAGQFKQDLGNIDKELSTRSGLMGLGSQTGLGLSRLDTQERGQDIQRYTQERGQDIQREANAINAELKNIQLDQLNTQKLLTISDRVNNSLAKIRGDIAKLIENELRSKYPLGANTALQAADSDAERAQIQQDIQNAQARVINTFGPMLRQLESREAQITALLSKGVNVEQIR